MVQNYGNPQTLNRYTYCLNNPLSYTDPTGNEVDFENESAAIAAIDYANSTGFDWAPDSAMDSMVRDWSSLRGGWSTLSTAAPDVTSNINDSNTIVTVKWNSQISGGQTKYNETGNIDILLGNGLKDMGTDIIATYLGHEAFHAEEAIEKGISLHNNTAANEAFAYGFGYAVATKLGCVNKYNNSIPGPFMAFNGLNPFMSAGELENRVQEARGTLLNVPNSPYFRGLGRLTAWPGTFGRDKGKFLSVAQSVWVRQ